MSGDRFALARQMRGKVPELGDDYIERYIPEAILDKIREYDGQQDHEGFIWGPNHVFASKTKENTIVIIVAQKYMGWGITK